MTDKNNNGHPPAVVRALEIFEMLALQNEPLSVMDISNEMNIPYSSTYRIVKCLIDKGYLINDSADIDKYKLGFKILQLAEKMNTENNLIFVAEPVIRSLSEKTDQAVQIVVIYGDGIMVVDQTVPKKPISIIISNIKEKMAINISAAGKVLAAFLPPKEQELYLKKAWKHVLRKTKYTITDIGKYKEELEIVKQQKYSIDHEEYALGVGCLAVPIFDYSGHVIASLALTGHIRDYKNKGSVNFLLKHLVKDANYLSSQLGYCSSTT